MSVAILTMSSQGVGKNASSSASTGGCGESTYVPKFTPPFDFDTKQQGNILSAYFYGYAATNFLGSLSAVAFGIRRTMAVSLIGASLFTFLLVPLSFTPYPYEMIIISRFMVGFFCGPLYACMHEILGHWAPLNQRTALTVGTHAGNIMGLVFCFFTGYFIDFSPKGWEYYFYFAGGLGVLSLILWLIFVYDQPWEHPFINDEEKNMIIESLHPNGIPENEHSIKAIPLKDIFTCVHVYLAGVAHMGNNFILYIFLTGFTKFLNKVYGYPPNKASIYSIIPFMSNFIFQLVASMVTQHLQKRIKKPVTFFRKVNGIIGFIGAFVFMIPVGFTGCDGDAAAIVLLTLCMSFLAFNQCSFFTAMVDLAPDYSGIIMGISNTLGSVSGFVNPAMVASFTYTHGAYLGWRYSFIATASVTLLLGSLWIIFASSETQPWALAHNKRNKSTIGQAPTKTVTQPPQTEI